MRRLFIPFLFLFSATSAIAADLTFSNIVRCQPNNEDPKLNCDGGLSISGEESSTIVVSGAGKDPVNIRFNAGELDGQVFSNCPTAGGTITIVVHKRRTLFPSYRERKETTANGRTKTSRTNVYIDRGTVEAETSCANLRLILDGTNPVISFSVGEDSYTVPIRFQKWWVESGGFYAYSWARSEQLVTAKDSPKAGQTTVVFKRNGDRVGPSTGVTFIFHPADYPVIGWEFGTATGGDKSTSYYLGGTLRLIQFNDRSLVTVGAGISHVNITTYPGVKEGLSYASDDPILTGRVHYINRPYVSLGLGISFGGPSKPSQ